MRRVSRRGFTLIELVMTVAIVAVLATGLLPLAEIAVQRNREQELHTALRDIRGALDAYRLAEETGHMIRKVGSSGYPPNLHILVDGVLDAQDPDGRRRIYFLRRIPRDPMFADASRADEATWGLRSYASSADAPEEGDDVFDVYSLSTAVGLNGVAYRNW
jgi:general secretion pathway protein G